MVEGQEGVSWEQWLALAHACEQAGISAMFRSDHYLNLEGGHPERGSLDAWATIAGLAAVTSRLRLGTLVSPATFRHPSTLAKMVSTADHISGGRIELGIGAGWNEREHQAYGFEFPPTRARIEILQEQLEVIHRSWAPDPSSFEGAHYRLRELNAQPKPIQQPHPPLIIGGSGGPRSVALAARYADEYNTVFPTPEQAVARRGRLVEACEQAGRDPIPLSVMTNVTVAAGDAELRDRVRRLGEWIGRDAETLLRDPPAGWLIGTIDRVAEQLAALERAGVSRIMCQHLLHEDIDAVALLARLG